MLLLRVAVRGARQGLVMADRLDLTLWNLLNLLRAFTGHGLSQILVCSVVRVGEVGPLLFNLDLLACHRARDDIFKAANQFRAFRAFIGLLLLQESVVRLSLVGTLHVVNQLVLNLEGRLHFGATRALRRVIGTELNTFSVLSLSSLCRTSFTFALFRIGS